MIDPLWVWFGVVCVASAAGFCVGRVGSQRSPAWARWLAGGASFTLALWLVLHHRPDAALRLMPAALLSRIEGVAAAPAFMVLCGIASAHATARWRRPMVLSAAGFGLVYLVRGGLWMIQPTPAAALANAVSVGPVVQTQDWSCVPASCATALHLLGVPTSEAEMGRLTGARPGVGSTLVRAVDGLERRLDGQPFQPRLVRLNDSGDLRYIPGPVLTALRLEPGQRHMVVIVAADHAGVRLADPSIGRAIMDWPAFEQAFDGQVILFDGAPVDPVAALAATY
ncbi:MAG: cysteine peptidase family C39 domain-containing protein [Planctomycetota bacterium]